MLSEGQIKDAFALLNLPLGRALEGSPIYIDCPFKARHTGKNRGKDARLYFDTHPHVFCLHDHCAEERHKHNYLFRVAILGTPNYPATVYFVSVSSNTKEIEERVAKEREALIAKFSKRLR